MLKDEKEMLLKRGKENGGAAADLRWPECLPGLRKK
jgi:hypothetical protein